MLLSESSSAGMTNINCPRQRRRRRRLMTTKSSSIDRDNEKLIACQMDKSYSNLSKRREERLAEKEEEVAEVESHESNVDRMSANMLHQQQLLCHERLACPTMPTVERDFHSDDDENQTQQQRPRRTNRLIAPSNNELASSTDHRSSMHEQQAKIIKRLKCKRTTTYHSKANNQQLTNSSSFNRLISCATLAILLLNSLINFDQTYGREMVIKPAVGGSSSPLSVNNQQQLLMKSANVELNRRSLQRPQREAVVVMAATNANQPQEATSVILPASGAPTCGYPGSPAHASVTFNTTHVVAGTAASYTCDNGYELLGPPRRICQSNGTWLPVGIPFCVLNVGLGKAAMQSSTVGGGTAQKAVDGSTSPYFQTSTCTMTDVEHNPWWYVNLLEPYLVQIVRIDFGTACCANRQKATIAVRVGNNRPDLGNNPLCNRYHGFIEEGKPLFLPCTRPAPGAFVSIHLEAPSGSSLSICETFIYTDHALSIEQCPSFRDQPLGSTATYNGKCYLFHNNHALNFEGARKYCESRGGTLVDETSPALQGFLSWELYRRHRNDQLMGQYWLGATRDSRNQQNWKWINGKDVQISFWNQLATSGNCSRFDGSKGWLWSDTDCQAQLNFICQYRPLSCGKPEKPTNSTLITKNVDNGTVIEYQCAPGNLLMGPKSRACLPTGFFSEFAPKCKYLDCQFPAMIPNGDYKLLNGTTSYQSTVTYYCNEGHQLYGKSTLTCDVDERWNGPPPRCEPLLCPAPVAPSNGYVTVTSNITIPGTQATYDCRPGYELVGDRLLSCLQSGSWDNSFPYCREKRHLSPHLLQIGGTSQPGPQNNGVQHSSSSTTAAPTRSQQSPAPAKPQASQPKQQPSSSNSIQFPAMNRLGGGNSGNAATAATTVSPPPQPIAQATTTMATTAASTTPASLNGLAGQFVSTATNNQQQQSSLSTTGATTSQQQQANNQNQQLQSSSNELFVQPQQFGPSSGSSIDLQRKPQTGSGNQFVSLAEQSGNSNVMNVVAPTRTSSSSPQQQQQQAAAIKPVSSSATNNLQQSVPQFNRQQQPSLPSTTTATANNNNNQAKQFAQNTPQGTTLATGQSSASSSASSIGYDSSPLATNSISVHSSSNPFNPPPQTNQLFPQQSSSQAIPHSTSTTTATSFAPPTTPFSSNQQQPQTTTASAHHFSSQHHSNQGQLQATNLNGQHSTTTATGGNVLASFSPPVRAHNAMANAKYSLDGIIAVAIFGGFIFLGAIITILVIIVRRRKSSQSSTIDAQTISTYDSNGEHNGLYRNYQQAWENLRFAAPNSQPKSSGNGGGGGGGVSLITAHVSGGPSLGLKNYASPGVALLHNQSHHHHAAAAAAAATSTSINQLHGHHNLAMSSSSSQSSSSLGGTGLGAGSGGGDPLLGPHHHHHRASMLHHHHQQQQLMGHNKHLNSNHVEYDDDEEEEVDDDDEQGVISADETGVAAGYGSHHNNHRLHNQQRLHHQHHMMSMSNHPQSATITSEGFRDSNELTINADTAMMAGGAGSVVATNSSSNSQGAASSRRRLYSTSSIGRSMAAAAVANRRSIGNNSSQGAANHHSSSNNNNNHHQHQRLVSSSTSSTSTHSSRASPPSDDHSLDQLAYGTNWPINLNQQ